MVETTVLTGTLVAVIMILTKILEYVFKKYQEKNGVVPKATLHPEVIRQIREIYESVQVVERSLNDIAIHSDKSMELIRQITENMKIITRTQEKTADLLDRIDRRLEIASAVEVATKRSMG